MLTVTAHGERGQTLPVWLTSVVVALVMTFFIFNYANTVRWQVRAQNAADSAAAAALGGDAASLNSVQTLLTAFDVQELRTRDVVSALPYLLGTSPCGATNLVTPSCTSALTGAATDLTNSLSQLASVETTISQFQNLTLTNNIANPNSTIASFFAPNGSNGCNIAILTDCDFTYTTYLTYDGNGVPTVDEYTCKKITNIAASFMHLPTPTYYVIGHSTETLAPLAAAYNATTLGSSFAAASPVYPSVAGNALIGNLAGLNINSGLFASVAAPPPTTTRRTADVCPA